MGRAAHAGLFGIACALCASVLVDCGAPYGGAAKPLEEDATADSGAALTDAEIAEGVADAADAACTPGTLGCVCAPARSCAGQLKCRSGLCVGVSSIVAGGLHACAVLNDGSMKCWGYNGQGQLGQGDNVDRGRLAALMGETLRPVPLPRPVINACAGRTHTCAVLDDHTARCWGEGLNGQLGRQSPADVGRLSFGEVMGLEPIDLGPGAMVQSIACGGSHTCAVLTGGIVKCWGNNVQGQLGLSSTIPRGDSADPGHTMGASLPNVDFGGNRIAEQLTLGDFHSCARFTTGEVKCWGLNDLGQLGQGNKELVGNATDSSVARTAPVSLGAGRKAVRLSSGRRHVCALLDDSSIKCWGFNGFGQLGIGSNVDQGGVAGQMDSLPPVTLGSGLVPVDVTAQNMHSCARFTNGTAKCWGLNNHGALGQGNATELGIAPGDIAAATAIDLGSGASIAELVAGGTVVSTSTGLINYEFTCARLVDSSLKCWGLNNFGQLGSGSTNSPVGNNANEMGDFLPRALVP